MTTGSPAKRNPLAAVSLLVLLVVVGLVLRRIVTTNDPDAPPPTTGGTTTESGGEARLEPPVLWRDDRVFELPVRGAGTARHHVLPVRFDRVTIGFASSGREGSRHAYEIGLQRIAASGERKVLGVLQHAAAAGTSWSKALDVATYGLGDDAPSGTRLELVVDLYDARWMEELRSGVGEVRGPAWDERRLDRVRVAIVRDREPPQIEPALADGTRLNHAAGARGSFAFLVPDEELSRAEIAGAEVDLTTTATRAVDRDGRRTTCIAVPWPVDAEGRPLPEVPVRIEDLAGWERRVTLAHPHDPLAQRPEPHVEPAVPARLPAEPTLTLADWSAENDLAWVDPGYEHPTWRAISWHRLVTGRQLAVLTLEVAGIAGDRLLVVEADPTVPPHEPALPNARYVAPYERRVEVRGPRDVVRVAIPLPPSDPGAAFLPALFVRASLWKPTAAGAAESSEPVGGALLARHHAQLFRDDLAPAVRPAIASGTPLAFPGPGASAPVLELQFLEHFPASLTVAGEEVTWSPTADPIDPGLVHVAPRSRTLGLPWPLDADGRPRRTLEVVATDRLGRRSVHAWSYPEGGPDPWQVPAARPFDDGPRVTTAERLRFLPTSGAVVPPWSWTARNVDPEGQLVAVRRVLSPFDGVTLRVHVDAPAGDYRLEVWQTSTEERPGRTRRDLIYDVRAGDVLEFPFDVSGIDGSTDRQLPDTMRFVLFRREHVPGYDRPKFVDHPTEFDLTEYYARALANLFVQVFLDEREPVLGIALPEATVVHPAADPAFLRPHPRLRFVVEERFPWEVVVAGRPIPEWPTFQELEDREVDRVSEQVGVLRRTLDVDWPDGPDGPRAIEIAVRDAFGRQTRRTYHYVYDRRAPELATDATEPLAPAAAGEPLEIAANELLRQATWIPAGAPPRRLEVRGSLVIVDPSILPEAERRGTLQLRDLAGNLAEIPLEFRVP